MNTTKSLLSKTKNYTSTYSPYSTTYDFIQFLVSFNFSSFFFLNLTYSLIGIRRLSEHHWFAPPLFILFLSFFFLKSFLYVNFTLSFQKSFLKGSNNLIRLNIRFFLKKFHHHHRFFGMMNDAQFKQCV